MAVAIPIGKNVQHPKCTFDFGTTNISGGNRLLQELCILEVQNPEITSGSYRQSQWVFDQTPEIKSVVNTRSRYFNFLIMNYANSNIQGILFYFFK